MVRENQVIRAGLYCLLVLSNQVYAVDNQASGNDIMKYCQEQFTEFCRLANEKIGYKGVVIGGVAISIAGGCFILYVTGGYAVVGTWLMEKVGGTYIFRKLSSKLGYDVVKNGLGLSIIPGKGICGLLFGLIVAEKGIGKEIADLKQANRDLEARMEAMEARFAAIQACSISAVQTRSSTRTNSLVDSVSSSPAGFSILS